VARRRGRSVSRGPKNNIWTVVLLDNQAISTSVVEANIVEPDDWQPSTSGFERATLLRVRGWLAFTGNQPSLVVSSMFAAIYVTDADDSVNSPAAVATYTKEDVLWTWGVQVPAIESGGIEAVPMTYVAVDIKAMRKIDSARELRLTLVGSVAFTGTVSGVLRALIRKGGN